MAIPTIKDRIAPLGIGAVIAVLAGASVLLPFAPVYDPWAWLVWGRELGDLELDTAAGPSWKPLPVGATAVLAPAGAAAPELWLALARAGWLAAVVLAWRLAARLAVEQAGLTRGAGMTAGAVAALGFVLVHDSLIPPVRQFAGGLAEPLLAALVLGAVDRGLAGRHRPALALAVGAALLRPETWPFCAAYGVWAWRREPALRPWLGAAALAVPALWLGPDLAGSESPLTGAERARGGGVSIVAALEGAGRGVLLAPIGLTLAAAVAVAEARRRGTGAIPALAAGSVAWIALVAAMAGGGYAGLARFSLPAGALVCVLGGVGVVVLAWRLEPAARIERPRVGAAVGGSRPWPAAVVAVLAAVLVVDGAWRAAGIPGQAADASRFATEVEELFALVEETGSERLTGCGSLTTTDLFTQTALAWKLDLGLSDVGLRTATAPRRGVVLAGPHASARVRQVIAARGTAIARRGPWSAHEIACRRREAPVSPSLLGDPNSDPGRRGRPDA